MNEEIRFSFFVAKLISILEGNKFKTVVVAAIKGLNHLEYQCLISIPGIGQVYVSGILAEIGTLSAFHSQEALAMYAGIVWKQNQSGDFRADDTKMSKAGNKYLRYYLIEAANSVRNNIPEYRDFYLKKYLEVRTH